MAEQPFHHGHLRAELLDRAERVVREDGPEGLSLRELARQAGVSHAAPRRHFPDRAALLDAVAAHGFERLTTVLEAAAESGGPDPLPRFRAAATAYVDFAAREARIHDLMFAAKTADATPALDEAAARFFAVSGRLLGSPAEPDADLYEPRRLLIIVALQGLAALIAGGRLDRAAADAVLDEAARTFFPGTGG